MMEQSPIFLSRLSLDSTVPLYFQLVNIIKKNISAGRLGVGDLLPSEAELCRQFRISRSTVRQAIGALESEGLVVRRQGRGTFVSEPNMRRRSETVYSFTSEINALGKTPSSTLLEFELIAPDAEIAEMLELTSPDTKVFHFTRVRNVDGEPLILETSYYPQFIYPDLTRELLQTHSFYSLLYEVGIVPAQARDSYEAVCMSAEQAALLGCKEGSGAFSVCRRTYNEHGMCYEFTRSLARGDRVKLDVLLQRDGVSFSRMIDQAN